MMINIPINNDDLNNYDLNNYEERFYGGARLAKM